jgi:hypothetical protein
VTTWAEQQAEEIAAMKAGHDLRTNPALCRFYAARHTQEHAEKCLAHWRNEKKNAGRSGDWRKCCVEAIEKWTAIIAAQRAVAP